MSLRAERSNPIHNKIKHFEIAASLTLLAMTFRIEFFRKLLRSTSLHSRIQLEYPPPIPSSPNPPSLIQVDHSVGRSYERNPQE